MVLQCELKLGVKRVKHYCRICGREIKSTEAVRTGIGSGCKHKYGMGKTDRISTKYVQHTFKLEGINL